MHDAPGAPDASDDVNSFSVLVKRLAAATGLAADSEEFKIFLAQGAKTLQEKAPTVVLTARDAVYRANNVFYASPSRETAIVYRDSCRRSAARIAQAQAPAPDARRAASDALQQLSDALASAARVLRNVDVAAAEMPQDRLAAHADAAAKVRAAEIAVTDAIATMEVVIAAELLKSILADIPKAAC